VNSLLSASLRSRDPLQLVGIERSGHRQTCGRAQDGHASRAPNRCGLSRLYWPGTSWLIFASSSFEKGQGLGADLGRPLDGFVEPAERDEGTGIAGGFTDIGESVDQRLIGHQEPVR